MNMNNTPNNSNQYFDVIFNSIDLQVNEDRKKLFYEKYQAFKDNIPFDIARFARELQINLFGSKDFNDHQSGKIEYDPISKNYSIYINANHSLNRIVFTLAHEVGHFFCDKDYLEKNSFILEDQRKINSLSRDSSVDDLDLIKREVRANKFAAELLMPTEKFIEIWKKTKNIEEIATLFKVSTEAVKYRAVNVLGVIL